MTKVEFVKYVYDHHALCRGTLYVILNGKYISFGAWSDSVNSACPDYPPFWESGGEIEYGEDGVIKDYCQGPWKLANDIRKWDYTEEIRLAFPELIRIMNQHVKWGCCGGCVFKPIEI